MAERKIAGTDEVYTGMVVKLGEFEYTTVGGGIEGDRQQLEPAELDTDTLPPTETLTSNADSPQYLEDYDIGTGDGILSVADVIYWNNLGRNDIAQFVTQFLTSGNMPPNRPTQNEDVVTPFVVGDGSTFGNGVYFYADGSQVSTGTELHHHTIPPNGRSNFMTQHVMDGNDVDVFTNIGGQANNQNTNQQNQQSGMNGNGGNTGGGPSY